MASKPLLVYWDIRVLAEPIRLLLNYLEVDFEDKRIPFGNPPETWDWSKYKYSHGLDFQNLPFYVDDDVKLTQSMAILSYLGKKYNLAGDNIKEQAIVEMICQTASDIRIQAWLVYNAPNFHEIKEDWKTTIPSRWAEMNAFLTGKDYVLGKKLSYADFFLYESVEWFRTFAKDLFETHEGLRNLNSFQERIEALPQIKAYLQSSKFKALPMFAPVVHFGHSQDPNFKPIPCSYRNYMAKYPLDP